MDEITPLISIIMPVYNVEDYISVAIKSVLDQTYRNFELLVVNDGTPDGSVAIVEEFVKKDFRVQLLHKENGGLSDARNFGLQYVRGSYVYFIDSDDWITPDLLEVALQGMEQHQADVLVFGYHFDTTNVKGELLDSSIVSHKNSVYDKGTSGAMKIDSTLLNLFGYAWNKLYRTSYLKKQQLTFPKGVSLVEDILFNSRALGYVDRIVVLENAMYHYMNRQRETLINTYHSNSFELILMKTKALDTLLSQWNFNEEDKRHVLADSIVTGIRYCVNNMFAYKNQLSFFEKYQGIKSMLGNSQTKNYSGYYKTSSFFDKIYKFLIKNNHSLLLSILCKIKK